MAKKFSHLQRKYDAIRSDFTEMKAQGYMSSAIYEKLAVKYFMAPITIDDIVWKNGIYADEPKPRKVDKQQMSIFDVIPNYNEQPSNI